MRSTGVVILLAVLSLGLQRSFSLAQEPENQPSREQADDGKRYYPPPAWKSVEIGDYYWKRKNWKAALSRYQEAVQADPHYPRAYLGLGKAYERMGLKKKALDAYQKFLDELPSQKDALEAKGAQQAVVRLQKELKISPTAANKPAPSAPASH